MDSPNQQDGVNITKALEALSPYLNNPRQTVMRIESLVIGATVLLFLQLFLGSHRRRWGNWFVQGLLWAIYTALFPLITYTLGQMVSSPVKNALYPLWAVFLFWAAACTNSIIAYDLEDNKRWKQYLFELFQYFVYLSIILRLLNASSSFSHAMKGPNNVQPIQNALQWLLTVLVYTNFGRSIASWMVTNSTPSKFVADYMRNQASPRGDQPETFNPITMKGYKYLVCWPPQHEGRLRTTIKNPKLYSFGPITIDKIWEMQIDESLLNTNKGALGVKDLCLSFALSHLLKRRFFEMECAEATRPETRKFVLEGLLSEQGSTDNYARAFHIIEAELGFLYDFFFTKYATLFQMEVSYLILATLGLIFLSNCGAIMLRDFPILKTTKAVIEVGTRRVDVIITIIIMGSFILVEALQIILYVTSDWATVSLACLCTRTSTSKCILSLIRFLQRFKSSRFFGYWQNKMGQTSFIECSKHFFPSNMLSQGPDICLTHDLLLKVIVQSGLYISNGIFKLIIFSGKTSTEVPDLSLVKREIVSCLMKYNEGDPLTNGPRALDDHGVLGKFSWTLKDQSQTGIMLVWHIATEYCSMPFSSEREKGGGDNMLIWHPIYCCLRKKKMVEPCNQQVATTLSRYCAYLMSSVPDLLPGNSTDTLFTLERVLWDAKLLLNEKKPCKKTFLEAIQNPKSTSNEDTITIHDSRGKNDDITIVHDYNNTDDIIIRDSSPNTTKDEITIIVQDSSDNNADNTVLHNSSANSSKDSIFIQGLKLGKQLEDEIKDDDARWSLLAEFWAETIIYIAPSDNAKVHMERLAQGGEFLTHVWALLTHAGILHRPREANP